MFNFPCSQSSSEQASTFGRFRPWEHPPKKLPGILLHDVGTPSLVSTYLRIGPQQVVASPPWQKRSPSDSRSFTMETRQTAALLVWMLNIPSGGLRRKKKTATPQHTFYLGGTKHRKTESAVACCFSSLITARQLASVVLSRYHLHVWDFIYARDCLSCFHLFVYKYTDVCF